MTLSSPLFCDRCGAANRAQASYCKACGQPLHLPNYRSISTTLTGSLSAQSLLNQRYLILTPAGQGGFGAVYKATDLQFGNRLVAVKEMSQNGLAPQELTEAAVAFKREALMLAGLTHPNLPRIYEQFTDTGRSYLVMDFIEGETLEEQINKAGNKQLPLETVFEISLQLCSVLDYLHTRQPPIIFRDLKPANIMTTPAGHVYLIDFGIARHFKPGQSKDTTALGSTGYAAPEQYGKSQTTARADIYSLGATMHQMLTGDDPSETPFQFAPLKLAAQPGLAELEKLVMSMVSVDMHQRPATITMVKQELSRIVNQYKAAQTNPLPYTLAGSPSPQPKPRRTSRSSPRSTLPPVRPQMNMLYTCCGHTGRITAIAWSPDGKHLASASYDKTVRIWDSATGNHIRTYKGHTQRVNALSWSPDNKHLATASDDKTVQIWDTTTGDLEFTYYGHSGNVHAVAWSPDGRHIASGGEDLAVHVWQTQSHVLVTTYRNHTDRIQTIAWSPDGKRIASAGKDRKIHLWDPTKEQQKRSRLSQWLFPNQGSKTLERHRGIVNALAWSPDNKRLASASTDRQVLVWNLLPGTVILSHGRINTSSINTVIWSPDSKHLAFGGNNKTVQIWDAALKAQTFIYSGHGGYVITAAWSPDGSRIASGGVDRTVQVWQVV